MIGIRMLSVGLMCAVGFSSSAEGQRKRVALPLYGAQVVMDTIGERVEIDAPPGQVFAAATLVLQNYGIQPDVRDSLGGLVGSIGLVRTRRLNRTPLSVFLNCGSSMTGLRADYYRVTMPLLIMLDPAGKDRTYMRIALVASAQDPTGTSNLPVLCGSTGGLESRMRKAIEEQILVLRGGDSP